MKTKIVLPLLVIAALLLAACGSAASGNSTRSASGTQTGANPQELQLAEKLAIGTLKLEGTANAVTAKQAADLLPLWQVYSSLITSDTAAQEEKDALAQQIHDAMTSAQIQAIDNLNLTQRDVFASMQELGIGNQAQVNANGTPQANGGNGGGNTFFFGGGVPGGAPGGGGNFQGGSNRNGGGGGGFGGNGQVDPSQIATLQARRAANGGGFNSSRVLTPLVQAVIKLLESKS